MDRRQFLSVLGSAALAPGFAAAADGEPGLMLGDPRPFSRKALVERFELSQTIYQKDPWAELAQPDEAPKFAPLADLKLEAAE